MSRKPKQGVTRLHSCQRSGATLAVFTSLLFLGLYLGHLSIVTPVYAQEARTTELLASDQETLGVGERIQVASSTETAATLSQLVFEAGPGEISADAATRLADADALREYATIPEAYLAYLDVVDRFPDSPQANSADERIAYLLGGRSEAEMDAIEAALPDVSELESLDGLTVVGHFYFKRAQDLAASNPEKAGRYLQRIYDIAWPAFEEDLDDEYKSTLIMGYLFAADALGKGAEARAALSAHADTLPDCFTAWVIRAMVDGEEPPFEVLTTEQGKDAIRQYYLEVANGTSDRAVVVEYQTKVRDVSWQMLQEQPFDVPVFGHARFYLDASDVLGSAERAEAVGQVARWIEATPLSAYRWVVRYELAEFLVTSQPTGAEARLARKQFEAMIREAGSGMLETAINDVSIDENIRGLLVCVWGHAHAGVNQVSDAEVCYDWVLDYFTNETHAGTSAAFSMAQMEQRKHPDDLSVGIAAMEAFIEQHPGSFYSAEALMEVAERYERSEDSVMARQTYERIEKEYWDTSLSKKAGDRRESLSLDGGGSE